MTDKLEPCRAMVDGKFCGADPVSDIAIGGVTIHACRDPRCHQYHEWHIEGNWNTLQLDRLKARRWDELCGRGLVSKADVDEIDLAINQPPKGENEGT